MPQDYSVTQKVIHWLMGLVIMLDLFVAQKFGGFLEEAERLQSRMDHATLGTMLAVLLLLRLFFRWKSGAPALPEAGMSGWQIMLAKFVHVGLYAGMILLLGTGVVTAMQATDPILIFQSFDITLGQMSEDNFVFLRRFHDAMTWIMIGLIVLHVAGALYHQFIIRDRILVRMLKFWTSEKSQEGN